MAEPDGHLERRCQPVMERVPSHEASRQNSKQSVPDLALMGDVSLALEAVLPMMRAMLDPQSDSGFQMSLHIACPAVKQLVFFLNSTGSRRPLEPPQVRFPEHIPCAKSDDISRPKTPQADDLPRAVKSDEIPRFVSHTDSVDSATHLTYDAVCSGGYDMGSDEPSRRTSKNAIRRLSLSPDSQFDFGSRRRGFKVVHDKRDSHNNYTINSTGEAVSSENLIYIHPEKTFRLAWDFCTMMLILALLIVIPLELAFYWKGAAPAAFDVLSALVDVFFGVDIMLSFVTAYHSGHAVGGVLMTSHRHIAVHYARGWMGIDLLATFPYSRVATLFSSDDGDGNSGTGAAGMLRVMRIAKAARIMKVLRVLKLGGLMQIVEEKLVAIQSMTVAFQIGKMTVVMLLMCHLVCCLWYAVAALNESGDNTWLKDQDLVNASGYQQYTAAFYFAITTGTTVGYGDIVPRNTGEQICTSLLLIFSVGYITQFLGKVSVMVNSLRHEENMVAQSKREALLFMIQRSVPQELQFKVLRYIEHTSETLAVTALDTKIMGNLSDSLQGQLALAVTGHVLRQFPLFAELPDDFVSALCRLGYTQRAASGEIVVAEEQPAHEMYFVVRGEVTVTREDRHLTCLRSGDWFGELVLFFAGVVRSATVRCDNHCEFFVLHHDQFHKTMSGYRHVKRKYDKLVKELRHGNVKGLKLKCTFCGSSDHLSRDCPQDNLNFSGNDTQNDFGTPSLGSPTSHLSGPVLPTFFEENARSQEASI